MKPTKTITSAISASGSSSGPAKFCAISSGARVSRSMITGTGSIGAVAVSSACGRGRLPETWRAMLSAVWRSRDRVSLLTALPITDWILALRLVW